MTNKDRLLATFRKTAPMLANDIKMYRLVDSHTIYIELYSGHSVKFTYFSKDNWELKYTKPSRVRKEYSDERQKYRNDKNLRQMREKIQGK